MEKSYHSICAWTFNAGKGGFTPSDIRKDWEKSFDTIDKVKLIKEKIAPRLPSYIVLGLEAHYDYEYNEENAKRLADALVDSGIYLAMATPGAHRHFAYGGICSPDKNERAKAVDYGIRAVDLVYGPLKKAWMPGKPPTFVLWNGSFGYDMATVVIRDMYNYLKENIAGLCKYEEKKGGKLFMAIEPKPNEGHPAMLLPTVASAILFWKKLEEEYKIDISKKGINKEFGHSEMIGLDHVYDTVEEIDNNMLIHMHINSQGYNDGILLGGPGKFDIDNGARINGFNIAIAGLIKQAKYKRWKGHDMQPRAYDNEEQAVDRVVRSILSWDACEKAAEYLDYKKLNKFMENRETAKAEDMMRDAVVYAQKLFDKMYK
ncbi:MAG: xylose isomerase [Candidatus Goldbacteria bacterium]|nr:xylose isomerase [Candidatus Goldiibacteriota bacterium]